MKKILILACLLPAVLSALASTEYGRAEFDHILGEEGQRVCLRLPKLQKEVKGVLYTHQNMTEEVLFRSLFFTSKMDTLGVAMVFVQSGSQNWDVSKGCQERFEHIIDTLAGVSGHKELKTAGVIPFGHSAQATFPWNFAAWNPERTFCVISFHGDAPRTNLCGYGRENMEWGRTRNIDSIPALMIEGEYEWWEARVRPALAFRMMYPESRISFLCDAEKGHFDLCDDTQRYIARFIEKALENPRPAGGVYYSRWSPSGVESEDPHDQFWYFDREMADWTKRRYDNTKGKELQWLGATFDCVKVPYDSTRHVKMNVDHAGKKFTVKPFFSDESRNEESDLHAQVRPRVYVVSGPVVQTGEYTFSYDPDYFGKDPKRMWTGATLCLEADGDDRFKSAVQEITIHFDNPEL